MSPVAEREAPARETVTTPAGERVSVPVVARRSWAVLVAFFVVVLGIILVMLITHLPPAPSPTPNSIPSGSAQPVAPGQQP